jgi:hypothetical protein
MPSVFRFTQGDVPGGTISSVTAARSEGNMRAWEDARPKRLVFYRGSWAGLGRSSGFIHSDELCSAAAPQDDVARVIVQELATRAGS